MGRVGAEPSGQESMEGQEGHVGGQAERPDGKSRRAMGACEVPGLSLGGALASHRVKVSHCARSHQP